jgi:hypothetical protein
MKLKTVKFTPAEFEALVSAASEQQVTSHRLIRNLVLKAIGFENVVA